MQQINFTNHCLRQILAKGFTPDQIRSALTNPEVVTDVRRYPGQKRYCGAGVAIVVDGNQAITVYADKIVTPLRQDQMNDKLALNSRRLNRKANE